MTLFILYAGVALVGSGVALWRTPALPRANWLLILAALPQIAAIIGLRSAISAICSIICIAAWYQRNRTIPGAILLLVGSAMNLLTMAAHNGAMPIHQDILAIYDGQVYDHGTVLIGSKDMIVSASPLLILSDWIDIPLWGRYGVIASPGDIVIAIGIMLWLWRKETGCSTQQQDLYRSIVHSTDTLDRI